MAYISDSTTSNLPKLLRIITNNDRNRKYSKKQSLCSFNLDIKVFLSDGELPLASFFIWDSSALQIFQSAYLEVSIRGMRRKSVCIASPKLGNDAKRLGFGLVLGTEEEK